MEFSLMVHDMNYFLNFSWDLSSKTIPTVDWSKYIETSSNMLIPNLLLVKCGVGHSLLPSRNQAFPCTVVFPGINSVYCKLGL
jgi:hypothetical protein